MKLNKLFIRWKDIIVLTAAIRIFLTLFSLFISPGRNFFYLWNRWDYSWYIDIARDWYQISERGNLYIVFYPLYPLLIRLTTEITNNYFTSTILVSVVFSFLASIALFELTILDFNRKTALLAVWFLNIFPTSYFLQASYTESTFLTLSILSVYFLRKNKPVIAGLFGLMSTMSRSNGILLWPSLLIESKLKTKNLITLLLTPLGFCFYLFINYLTFGNIFYFTKPLFNLWYKKLSWPWEGITRLIHSIPPVHDRGFYLLGSEIIAIILTLLISYFVFFKIRKSYGIYLFLNLLLFISTSFILGTPRYMLVLFPIFIYLAKISNKITISLISIIFIVILIHLTSLYTKGLWTF